MKVVKAVVKVLVGIVAFLAVALLTLPLWFGPVAKTVANAIVPGIVKTDFNLGHLSLNPYTARFELGDLQLGNPAGYSEKYAVTVGDVAFDAKTFSLMTDVIHIEEIKIKDLFVSYVSGGAEKVNNFRQIQYNVSGGREKYEAARSAKEAETASVQDDPVPVRAQKADAEKPPKKFIIDRVEISGLMVQLGFVPLRIPSFVMTDIGRKSGGVTAQELRQQIWDAILKAAGVVGENVKKLGASVQTLGQELKEHKSMKAVGEGAKAVGDSAKKTLDSLKGLW